MKSNLSNFNKLTDNIIVKEIKNFAFENKVPIISDDGLSFLLQMIRVSKSTRILEIGSAIGYSAINMALLNSQINVDTIEKNEKMYNLARENINRMNLNEQVRIFLDDALEINLNKLRNDYDLIFIDAAKAQYIKFFERFSTLLNKSGIIISDNLQFHGLVNSDEVIESRNLRALVRKINNYNVWLSENTKYHTLFLEIGDGMALSKKNEIDCGN